MTDSLHRARELLASSSRLLVLTGAGISAESGVPTFRGAGGLWRNFRAEDLATPGAFARDPRLSWEWYGWRREIVRGCRPNEAHHAVARLALGRAAGAPSGGTADSRPGEWSGARVVTQNVDGLHAQAARDVAGALGVSPAPAMPLELHGSIWRARCTRCGARREDHAPVDAASADTLPRCDDCGALARPDVVWFGETLDPAVLGEAQRLAETADVCLVIGTSGVVYPAAGLAGTTREAGGAVIEVNPDATPLTPLAAASLRGSAVEMMRRLCPP